PERFAGESGDSDSREALASAHGDPDDREPRRRLYQLLVTHSRPGGLDRDNYFLEDLAGLDRRGESIDQELVQRKRALGAGADQPNFGFEGQQPCRKMGRRFVMRDTAPQ